MRCNPENRPTFERQRAANSKEILESQRHLIRTVSVQPMVAHADAKAGTHPVEEESDNQCTPIEHEECGYRSNVKKAEGDAIGPVDHALYKLPGIWSADCNGYVISEAGWLLI